MLRANNAPSILIYKLAQHACKYVTSRDDKSCKLLALLPSFVHISACAKKYDFLGGRHIRKGVSFCIALLLEQRGNKRRHGQCWHAGGAAPRSCCVGTKRWQHGLRRCSSAQGVVGKQEEWTKSVLRAILRAAYESHTLAERQKLLCIAPVVDWHYDTSCHVQLPILVEKRSTAVF